MRTERGPAKQWLLHHRTPQLSVRTAFRGCARPVKKHLCLPGDERGAAPQLCRSAAGRGPHCFVPCSAPPQSPHRKAHGGQRQGLQSASHTAPQPLAPLGGAYFSHICLCPGHAACPGAGVPRRRAPAMTHFMAAAPSPSRRGAERRERPLQRPGCSYGRGRGETRFGLRWPFRGAVASGLCRSGFREEPQRLL